MIRDPRTLRAPSASPRARTQTALSPDDRTLLLGERDGSVRFLDLVTGHVRTGSGRHDGAVVGAAFSADGRTAVTAGEDNRAIVWDVERAAAGETLAGHTGDVTGLAISRDGRTLYSASLDGQVLIWDLAGAHRLGRPFATGTLGRVEPGTASCSGRRAYALSSDGERLAIGRSDGSVAARGRPHAGGWARAAGRSRGRRSAGWRSRRTAARSSWPARPAPSRSSIRGEAWSCSGSSTGRSEWTPSGFSADGTRMAHAERRSRRSGCGRCAAAGWPVQRGCTARRSAPGPPRSAPTGARSPSPRIGASRSSTPAR